MSVKPKKSTRKTIAVNPEFTRVATVTENRVAVIKHNKGANRYDYGKNNLLPNELLNAVEASVTASSCRVKKSTFIKGRGFSDKGVASMKVNADQTANQLQAEFSDYSGLFSCVVAKVIYNMAGEPYSLSALEFECIRATDTGNYYLNENLCSGTDNKKDRVFMDVYNNHETPTSRLRRVRAQIEEYGKQTGDIIFHFDRKAGQKIYPKPVAWAAMEEIESDAALGRLDWRNVKKGFRPDAILTTVGKIDDTAEDESGRTEQDYFDKSLEQFSGEDATSLLHMQVDKIEEVPTLVTFDSEKLLNATTEASDRIARRVCRGMEVPDILIPGLARQGQLGNTSELLHTMKLFALTALDYQRLVSEVFEMVWPIQDWNIDPLELIEETPQWLIDKLTDEEVRQLGGYAPLEVTLDVSDSKISDALNTLSPLVATKVLEKMSDEEIRGLIGLTMEGFTAKETETP